MKNIKLYLLSMLLLVSSGMSFAEVLVVVHPSNEMNEISMDQAAQYFLGKNARYPGGGVVVAIDQEEGAAVRDSFYMTVANKNASQMNAYWSNLIFTGKGQPPKVVLDDLDVLELVSQNPNTIGYIDGSVVNASVKVVVRIP